MCEERSPGVFCKWSVADFSHCSNLTGTVSLAGYWYLCWLCFCLGTEPSECFPLETSITGYWDRFAWLLTGNVCSGVWCENKHAHSNSYRESVLALSSPQTYMWFFLWKQGGNFPSAAVCQWVECVYNCSRSHSWKLHRESWQRCHWLNINRSCTCFSSPCLAESFTAWFGLRCLLSILFHP